MDDYAGYFYADSGHPFSYDEMLVQQAVTEIGRPADPLLRRVLAATVAGLAMAFPLRKDHDAIVVDESDRGCGILRVVATDFRYLGW